MNAAIPVYGEDELGRIGKLLRHTLGQLNQQRQLLEQEIAERKRIDNHLRTTGMSWFRRLNWQSSGKR